MTNETKNALLVLGLCKKAGKLVRGCPAVCEAISSGHPPALVVLCGGASENSQKKITDKCRYYGVRLYRTEASTEELSHAVGGSAAMAAVALTDEGLAALFLSKAENNLMRKGE